MEEGGRVEAGESGEGRVCGNDMREVAAGDGLGVGGEVAVGVYRGGGLVCRFLWGPGWGGGGG